MQYQEACPNLIGWYSYDAIDRISESVSSLNLTIALRMKACEEIEV